jgi:hypothetical protein
LLPFLKHRASQFLNLGQSAGLLGWVISPSQGLYHTGQHKHRKTHKHKHPCLE